MSRYILLSFDVEEFDIPLEFKQPIEQADQLRIGKLGLDAIQPILSTYTSTLFTTANFADHFPNEIQTLSHNHEIASHTYYHGHFEDAHLQSSKERLEIIIGQQITGLRMPRMRPVSMEAVAAAGYTYDSSINPTFLPGKYNNLHLPRTKYFDAPMWRIPASVTPNLRIPLFWLSAKNMPFTLYKQLCIQTLKKDNVLCLYFHPWEFTDIKDFGLPVYTRRFAGPAFVERIENLLKNLSTHGECITMHNFNQLSKTL
jgi:peptidoglycan/xylan/chitin deacetylase (PgdA/CDA1 family)